ncbi:cell envelope integrity protein TolA [Flavobacterium sp.]|jgi:hypothetical protein|uniref:cell envelope integrity protein TolA n=1 Tax=Flavobacterium sp. TaxID=239 RepID=UPI0037C14797
MQKIIFYVAVLLCTFVTQMYSQSTFEEQAKVIAQNISRITSEEKDALKKEVEDINKLLESGAINASVADERKIKAAEERAKNIETRVAQEQAKLDLLVKDQVEGKIASSSDSVSTSKNKVAITWDLDDDDFDNWSWKSKNEKRTTSQFVFAVGLNSLLTDGDHDSLENSDFKTWGSNFFEWGFTMNTRLMKNHNLLHLKYGLSLMYNNLRPTDNRYFVKNGNVTELQTFQDHDLCENKFRNSMIVLPLHLEFDFTPKTIGDDGVTRFKTHKSVRLGLGGFAGLNFQTTQKLKWEEDDIRIKYKQKGDFNVNTFVYGLSGYLGYGATSIYVKYNLNELFKNNPVDQNNVSLGLRFDFN